MEATSTPAFGGPEAVEGVDGSLENSKGAKFAFLYDMEFDHVYETHLKQYVEDPEWQVKFISKGELDNYKSKVIFTITYRRENNINRVAYAKSNTGIYISNQNAINGKLTQKLEDYIHLIKNVWYPELGPSIELKEIKDEAKD